MNPQLTRWNTLAVAEAQAEILPCNGSVAWAASMAAARPFITADALLKAADAVWAALAESDQQQAFDSHPRLGETTAHAATTQSLAWSAAEQGRLGADGDLRAALHRANKEYERRFGRVFLLCASGKSTTEVLAALRGRLLRTSAAERAEAAEQQRRITQLRLRRWLGEPAARCEDV